MPCVKSMSVMKVDEALRFCSLALLQTDIMETVTN